MNNFIEEGVSKLKAVKHYYTWKIKDFHNWPTNTNKVLVSPEFLLKVLDQDVKCAVYLYHEERDPDMSDDDFSVIEDKLLLHIEFHYDRTLLNDIKNVHIHFSVHNNQGDIYRNFADWEPFTSRTRSFQFLNHSVIMNPANNRLCNNTLIIFFEITIPTGVDNTLQKANQLAILSKIECNIRSDLENLFKKEEFSDVTITASCRKTFHAHKGILAARSKVFAAMFKHNMLESNQNAVNIDDIDGKIMLELLCFIYSGKIDLPADDAIKIMCAADLYEIIDLREMCESIVSKSINFENVVDIFITANKHNAEQLKNKCLNFMGEKQELVIKSSGFQNLITNGDKHLHEILQYFGKCNN